MATGASEDEIAMADAMVNAAARKKHIAGMKAQGAYVDEDGQLHPIPEKREFDSEFFDRGSAAQIEGRVPEALEAQFKADFVPDLCNYGKERGFTFDSVGELQIVCGFVAFNLFSPEFNPVKELSNNLESRSFIIRKKGR